MPVRSTSPGRRRQARPKARASLTQPGETRVLRWKGGKRAAFMIEFDDSAPSHLEYVIPALRNRQFPGTFYINPGTGPYKSHETAWENAAKSPGIELANHTYSHIGGATADEFEREISLANQVIDRLYPGRPRVRLRSWARPGVPKRQWGIGEKDIRAVLARHHMIERPEFFGPPFSIKTVTEMRIWVDGAIESGELRHLVFHGVGADWHSAPLNYFFALLDKLEERADDLWLTDPLSSHKYAVERDGARVDTLSADESRLRLSLTSSAAPALYDEPLTLATALPEAWTSVAVTQAGRRLPHVWSRGEARYDAIPGAGEIVLRG